VAGFVARLQQTFIGSAWDDDDHVHSRNVPGKSARHPARNA
jgi:hypothetical protein